MKITEAFSFAADVDHIEKFLLLQITVIHLFTIMMNKKSGNRENFTLFLYFSPILDVAFYVEFLICSPLFPSRIEVYLQCRILLSKLQFRYL